MNPNSTSTPPNGIIPFDKPAGITSHDAVAHVRRTLQQRRVGHTGTLDPFATGLLLMLVGTSTRLAEYAHAAQKTYEAEIRLGATSDTDDLTGTLTPRGVPQPPTRAMVEQIVTQFVGTSQQLPPWYSAIKIGGTKLYEYARRAPQTAPRTVTRTPRTIHIDQIDILSYHYPRLELRIVCGSGTYIRALGRDIGERLQTGGYVTALRRTKIGTITVQQAAPLAALTPASWHRWLLPPSTLVQHLPRVVLDALSVAQLRQGRAVDLSTASLPAGPLALVDGTGELHGIGTYDTASHRLLPHKML